MKKFLPLSMISLLAFFLFTTTAYAVSILGNQITVSDQKSDGSAWHGSSEDQEVEPGMAGYQKWDLEGFFLNGNTLSMVGGFNFETGESGSGHVWTSGDIFFDVDGTPLYGTDILRKPSDGNLSVADTYGYDYAIRLNFSATGDTFNLYQATTPIAKTISSFYKQNYSSNPWQIDDNDNSWEHKASGGFDFYSGLTDAEVGGFLGGSHYAIQLLLPSELQGFNYVHFTEQCGNDNMMGAVPTPEPATILLFGTGLVGLAGFSRKRFIKN